MNIDTEVVGSNPISGPSFRTATNPSISSRITADHTKGELLELLEIISKGIISGSTNSI